VGEEGERQWGRRRRRKKKKKKTKRKNHVLSKGNQVEIPEPAPKDLQN